MKEPSVCKNCTSAFQPSADDRAFYKKIGVPEPTWCPRCRELRRMAFCNEGTLYSSSCSRCNARIISQYASPAKWPVYCISCWWGDSWSGTDYGKDPDFGRSFFEQFQELERTVPHACVSTDIGNENSEYTHHAGQEKNCYLLFHATFCTTACGEQSSRR